MADLADAAAEFAELARNLNLVGFGDLRRELDKAVNDAAKPIADEIGSLAHLQDDLPDTYADALAEDLKVTISKRTTGDNAGVSVIAQSRGLNTASPGTGHRPGLPPSRQGKGRKLRRLDAGLLTHPLYGDREHWYTQHVTPGFFTGPAESGGPHARDKILEAMRRIADKATGKG